MYIDVSENRGTPKSSILIILIGLSLINHPFGVPLFLETPTYKSQFLVGGFNPFEKYARQIGSFP